MNYSSISDADFRILFESSDSSGSTLQVEQEGLVQHYETHVEGEWKMTVLEKEDSHIQLVCQLRNAVVKLEINGNLEPEQAEQIAIDLSLKTFIELSPDGRVLSIFFDPAMDEITRSFFKTLVAKTQFVLPEDTVDGNASWTVEEEDPSGILTASYEPLSPLFITTPALDENQRKIFRKTRKHYQKQEPIPTPNQRRLDSETVPHGNLKIVFNVTDGQPESIEGSEAETTYINNKRVTHAESDFEYRFIRKETVAHERLEILTAASVDRKNTVLPVRISDILSADESETLIQEGALGEDTLESLLSELQIAEAAGEERNIDLYLKVKALVYMEPASCDSLGIVLGRTEPGTLSWNLITTALRTIGHENAQNALIEAYSSRPEDPDYQGRIIQHLSMLDFPMRKTLQMLMRQAEFTTRDEIYMMTITGTGNMARNLSSVDPSLSDSIVVWIVDQASDSISDTRLPHLIAALGNTGSYKTFDLLKSFAEDPSEDIRAAAAANLGWIESDRVDTLLAHILANDPESYVRIQTAYTLNRRTPVPVTLEAQEKTLFHDEDVVVRLNVLRNFSEAITHLPYLEDLIRKAAKQDPAEEVQKEALRILSDLKEQQDR